MKENEIAQWMFDELKRQQCLYQQEVVYDIESKFGQEFTYTNENGNLAINRNVLKAFRKITSNTVVWERSERMWRMRQSYDLLDRRSVD